MDGTRLGKAKSFELLNGKGQKSYLSNDLVHFWQSCLSLKSCKLDQMRKILLKFSDVQNVLQLY
jgi:hypothetical protein